MAIGGGSIGGGTARPTPQQPSQDMSEPTPSSSASASPEAEILAALGTRLVVLVGMMGAGKSTIGRRLAARLHLPFLDADTEIEAAAGTAAPVGRLTEEREPLYQRADITVASRDVPHDKIVDECIEALHARLCGQAAPPEAAAGIMGALR